MRIVVIGAGPAGLYFAALMKKADPTHQITVLERNAPDATFGWGVVFSEETLGAFRDADRDTYDEITDTFAKWTAIDVKFRGETVRSRGHAFSAIARTRLLEILQRRCAVLGVDLRFHQEVDEGVLADESVRDADLVVGADGVNSSIRRLHQDAFKPEMRVHSTKYAWFGTDLVFKAFTFIFRENEHGLFQVHGYPFDAHASTFIVECPGETWHRAGLDQATEEESIAYCEKLFEEDLAGHRLLSNRSIWMSFVTLRNETWHDGNVAILGDAAHTAHFTIGSGTKLAMEDSVAVAEALQRHPDDMGAALTRFEMERQPMVERLQQAALESSAYFENVRRYAAFEPIQFAFNLLTRSGRISHLNLEMRDPAFVQSVDGWFATQASPLVDARPVVAHPPAFAPLRLREIDLANRVTLAQPSADDAQEGVPSEELARRLREGSIGAGLVLTEFVATSPDGRITPGTPGLWDDAKGAAWRLVIEAVRSRIHAAGGGPAIGVRLGHAGRRGATRPRAEGADRPIRSSAWSLVSASALPYTRHSLVPRELPKSEMPVVVEEFAAATARAADAGFDLLELDMSHGYLLASFLSPLSNRRTDEFGGSLERRLRFPMRVLDAVRVVWPAERPLAVRLTATDWASGGFDSGDAVAVASILRESGCDLVHVVAGQTVEHDRPEYARFSLVPASDRVRNEAGVPTLVGSNLTTLDDVNTILAAGRADLCVLDLRR